MCHGALRLSARNVAGPLRVPPVVTKDQGGHEDWKMSVLCFDLFVLWWPSAYERSSSIRRTGKTIGGIIIENMRNGKCANAARFTVNLTS